MNHRVVNRQQGHESFKRFIPTILNQITPYIEKYSLNDQKLLDEFFSILLRYEEAEYNRNELEEAFEKVRLSILNNKQYFSLPFLWFVGIFLLNARLILSVSEFHANSFYRYIAKQLRGKGEILGVFQLVRKNTPLSDFAWEKLQYESNKLLYPLSNQQFQILRVIYSLINDRGIDVLDPRKLRTAIVNQVKFSPSVKPINELSRFFRIVEGRWFLRFHSPAFGLDRLFFHLELNEGISLEEIIDFHSPESTVLGLSAVYYIRDHPNTYIGTLVFPTNSIELLKTSLQHHEEEGDINLLDLSEISTIHRNISLNNYKEDSGWFDLSQTKMDQIAKEIQAKHLRKKPQMSSFSYTTPAFNLEWNFKKHPLPYQIICLYCKLPVEFSFSSLPIQPASLQEGLALSRSETGLFKQLLYNQIVHVGFVPYRLVYEYSLDSYWITLPRIPLFQLKGFLNIIPYSECYTTKSSIHIWTRMSSKLIKWVKDDLKWKIYPILDTHAPYGPKLEWFDENLLTWIQPDIH